MSKGVLSFAPNSWRTYVNFRDKLFRHMTHLLAYIIVGKWANRDYTAAV